MKIVKLIIAFLLALLMIMGAFGHIFNPEIYNGFIPDFLSRDLVNLGSAIVEGLLGIAVFIPKFRKQALGGIFILMILFLPIHAIDAFQENPVIGSKTVAYIRLPIQFILIWMAWFAKRK